MRFRDEPDEDTALMLRARDGDAAAFAQLYRKYWPPVLAYLMTLCDRVDAPDDIAQEVFLRLWARRRRYQGKAKFRTYLFAYVRKTCLEQSRRHARRRALAGGTVQGALPPARPAEPPDAAVSRAETNESLRRALLRLTAEQREALRLFHLEGLSLQEAAARAGCSEECLESRLARGRDRLRCLLCASGWDGDDGRAHHTPRVPPAENLPKAKNPCRIPDSSVTNRRAR